MGNKTSVDELSMEGKLILEHLTKLDLFRKENPKQLIKVAASLRLEKFKNGDIIIKQNEESDSMYIIASGTASFSHVDPATGRNKIIASVTKGDTFGEFGLVYNVRRTAAVIATSDLLVALRLDREVYQKVQNSKFMKPLSKKVQKVCSTLMRDGLSRLPIMRGMKTVDVEDICDLFTFEVLPAGTKLIQEGQKPERFYLIFHGTVVVTRIDEFTLPYEICRLREGEGFGERALLSNGVTEATVTTLTPCEVFSLDSADFSEFLKSMTDNAKRNMARASYSSLLLGSVPIFRTLKGTHLNILCVASEIKLYKKGAVLIEEDSEDNEKLYVILRGKVNIKQSGKVIDVLKSGYFGEASLFRKKPALSEVSVLNNLTVLELPLKTFELILEKEDSVFSDVAIRVLGKEISLPVLLKHPEGRQCFFKHCKKEFSEESVEFIKEVRRLETLQDRSLARDVIKALGLEEGFFSKTKERLLRDKALQIFGEYIKEGSPNMINISSERRTELTAKIEKGIIEYDMFDIAKTDILNLVEQDTFVRFKDTKEFQAFLDKIGVYSIK